MKKGNCFIVGAGSFEGMSVRPADNDLIIAADGGYTYLTEMGIEPDVLMGDFDSLEIVPEHKKLIRHSPIKDDTDMALAVAYAADLGFKRFFLYGGLGGRLDHTLANLQVLNGMSRSGLEAYLIGEGIIVTAMTSERIRFSSGCKGTFSAFCLGADCFGVSEYGLKYGIEDTQLTSQMTLGVSNEFIGRESMIEVKQGTLIAIWDEENGIPAERIPLKELSLHMENLISEMGRSAMHCEKGEVFQSKGYRGSQGEGAEKDESEY